MDAFVEEVLRAYRKRVLFTRHALNEMNLSERMILRLWRVMRSLRIILMTLAGTVVCLWVGLVKEGLFT